MNRLRSQALYTKSCQMIPGGVNSPVRAFKEMGITPLVVASGDGDIITDVDGNRYIDYCGSWGSLVLGHTHPQIVQSVIDQLQKGSSFGITTEIEMLLAEKVLSHFPSMEKIRFVSSGTEAVMSAIRLARGVTGRKTIIKFNGNYHGHSDCLLVQAGSGMMTVNREASSKGVPPEFVQYTLSLPYNDVEEVRRVLRGPEEIAAVLIEPVAGNMGVVPASHEFLQILREETQRSGALLIFDEVISGFRVGLSGAQGFYSISPDLTCLGKIIGGGFPAAAFGGRKEIMDHLAPLGEVYQAGTLSGNPVAMRAGYETLAILERPGFYEELQHKTDLLLKPIQAKIEAENLPACLQSMGAMFTLFFGPHQVRCKEDLKALDQERFRAFFLHLLEKGVYLAPSAYEASFISMSHTEEHLIDTRDTILEFLEKAFSSQCALQES